MRCSFLRSDSSVGDRRVVVLFFADDSAPLSFLFGDATLS
jgi:hypothetical protein